MVIKISKEFATASSDVTNFWIIRWMQNSDKT